MEGEQKRVFLVLADDEIAGIRPPKGIYFTKFCQQRRKCGFQKR